MAPAPLSSTITAWTESASAACADRKSTRLNSSHSQISYAVFCLKKKKTAADEYDQSDRHSSTPDDQSNYRSARYLADDHRGSRHQYLRSVCRADAIRPPLTCRAR